jgi:hypothetical protein
MSNQVQPKAASKPEAAPIRELRPSVPALGREPGIVAFAVLRDGPEWVPTKLLIKDGQVVTTNPCGPKGIYKPTAYEYLMAAVMDHYRLEGLKT